MRDEREFDGLYARLEDMKKRAIRGELGISAFLSPRELHYACAYLGTEGYITFGGYGDAERKRIYFLPDYMEGVHIGDQCNQKLLCNSRSGQYKQILPMRFLT